MTTDPTFPAHLFDCLQVNLGVLADRLHAPGTALRLGATLRFRPRPTEKGLPTVEPSLDDVLGSASLLGLTVTRPRPASASVLAAGGTLYVIADAYHLPWVPYHRHRHIEHSFLVDTGPRGTVITDAYHNDTPWGAARPSEHVRPADELAAILADAGATVATVAPDGARLEPGPEPAHDMEAADAYLAAYAEHPDRVEALREFTLESWLLTRSRHLHAAYVTSRGGTFPAGAAEHLAEWNRLAEFAYLASRRAERGRAEPPELLSRAAALLAADARVFGVAAGAGPAPRAVVARVVAGVLGVDEARVTSEPLTEIETFSSFHVVDIVEQLEKTFAVEFAPESLVPERLHSLDSLCALVRDSLTDDPDGSPGEDRHGI